MSIKEFFNSEPVRNFRKQILSDTPSDVCSRCHYEEQFSSTSRRHRANQKSVIFTRTAFDDSFQASPGYKHFQFSQENNGYTNTFPIDLHVDLGNYCNMACKFCYTGASSKIAVQYVKWGEDKYKQFINNDWTRDKDTWNKFLNELVEIPKLKNIHLMGGETLITPRFEELVDFMIEHQRFDVCFSFVTNGSIYNKTLMDKLKLFSRVGIEVSIETTTQHNDYIRQGTDTQLVLENIEKFISDCNQTSISLTIRPTFTCLSLGYYYTLLQYCLEKKLLIKSLLAHEHKHLDVNVLPYEIKQQYRKNYVDLLTELESTDLQEEFNESDPNNFIKSIKVQVLQILNILDTPTEINETLLAKLVSDCRRWDEVYKFNARELYPELIEIFDKHGY
jgi:organic radical activating enzyme